MALPVPRSASVTGCRARVNFVDVTPRVHRLATLALALTAAGASACTGYELDARQDAEPEVEELHLGRVHVVLEPEGALAEDDEAFEGDEAFEVTARFAFVRGLEEDFARARIDMPVLARDELRARECIASEQLAVADAPIGELPQLHLVDAGDLRLQIGEDSVEVPLSLVPDLLPYMSGVEYLYYGDDLPAALSDEDAGGDGSAVVVEAKGSQTEELPPFQAEGTVPAALGLHATDADIAELRREAVVFRWRSVDTDDGLVTVRLTGLSGGEPAGGELTCVLTDDGEVRLPFDSLGPLGLMLDADALRVTVSRLQTSSFDAGDFMGSELVIERRERLVLPLRD